MKSCIISQKYGWYLARVNASIENFANIVATSLNTIYRFNLQPGRNVKISNLVKGYSGIRFLDKFVLLPYFKDFIKNSCLLQKIIQSITSATYKYVDKEYINRIIKIMSNFYQNGEMGGIVIKELLDFDNPENFHMNIALPESWLNENSVDLGETVLLRNDEPSPIIL
ncbi:MAG: hypothetical protein ACFE94_17720 [Candidatus Hodarchaeota archaeon]